MRDFLYEDEVNYKYMLNNHLINEAFLYAYPEDDVENEILRVFKKYDNNAKLINNKKNKHTFIIKINATIKKWNINILKLNLNSIYNKLQWTVRAIIINELLENNKIFNDYDSFVKYFLTKNTNCVNIVVEFIPNKIIKDAYLNDKNIVILDVYNYDYIYHLTDKKYVNKILKNGLIPKSGNKLGYNPEVIHLLKYLTDPGVICKIIEVNGEYKLKVDPKLKLENPVLLKINTKMLNGTGVIFLNDPGCNADNAIITYNQITPLAISIVNKDEYEWLHMNQKINK